MAAMITTVLAWITGNRRALTVAKWGAIALTMLLFLLSIRRAGERAGHMAGRFESMEKANDVQRRMPVSRLLTLLDTYNFDRHKRVR